MPTAGEAFHVAARHRLELDGDADQGRDLAVLTIADEGDVVFPLTFLPEQAARLAGIARRLDELSLEPLAVAGETVPGPAPPEPDCRRNASRAPARSGPRLPTSTISGVSQYHMFRVHGW